MVRSTFQQIRHRITTRAAVRTSANVGRWETLLKRYILPIAAVLVLVLWFNAESVNLPQHNRYMDALRGLRELDAQINQSLLQLRLGLLNTYDPIVHQQKQLGRWQQVLENPPNFVGSTRRQLQDEVQKNVQLWQQKDGLIQQFKSKHAILRNSLAYFPIAIAELADSPSTPPVLDSQLNTLLKDTLLFNLSMNAELIPRLKSEILQLRTQSNSGESNLSSVLTHAEIILTHSVETEKLIDAILALPTRQQGTALAEIYDEVYHRTLQLTDLYRLALFCLSTLIGITIAASIISRLRTAATALKQSETQLRNIFDNTQVGIFQTRLSSGLIVAANQYFVSMLGYDRIDAVVGVKQTDDFYWKAIDRA